MRYRTAKIKWLTLHNHPNASSSPKNAASENGLVEDKALGLASDLYHELFHTYETLDSDKFISIRPQSIGLSSNIDRTLIFSAFHDPSLDPRFITIPSFVYPQSANFETVLLSKVTPTVISNVIVGLNEYQYSKLKNLDSEHIQAQDLILPRNKNSKIIRSGESMILGNAHANENNHRNRNNSGNENETIQVLMCEPVDQGLCLRDVTKFTIVKLENQSLNDFLNNPDGSIINNQNEISNNINADDKNSNNNTTNGIESINKLQNDEQSLDLQIEQLLGLDDDLTDPKESKFLVDILPPPFRFNQPIKRTSSINKSGQNGQNDDYEMQGFIKTDDFAKIGCFAGDVVSIKCINGKNNNQLQKYIRVFSFPEPSNFKRNTLYISPILYHNLNLPLSFSKKIKKSANNDHNPNVIIKPVLPLGTTSFTNLIPIGKEVTISRIASPVTMDKSLQPAFLNALRYHFEKCLRVVSIGDIIALPIDTILSKSIEINMNENSTDLSEFGINKPDTMAWFMVVSLQAKKLPSTQNDDDEVNGEKSIINQVIVDPMQTRMIQSGIVQANHISSLIPWREYFGLPALFPYYLHQNDTDFSYANRLRKLLKSATKSSSNSSSKKKGKKARKNVSTSILLTSSTRGTGKTNVLKSIASELGIYIFELDGYESLQATDLKTIGFIRGKLEKAKECKNSILFISHIESLARKSETDGKDENINVKLKDFLIEMESNGVIIIASVSDIDKCAETLRSFFKFEIDVNVPSEIERKSIFEFLLKQLILNQNVLMENLTGNIELEGISGIRSDVSISNLALQSAGLTPRDILTIVSNAKGISLDRLQSLVDIIDSKDLKLNDLLLAYGGNIKLIPSDFEIAISEARNKYSDSIGAPRIPNVKWDDVGGLDNVKDEIMDTIDMPLKHPELFVGGLKKRSGILFYGPPGTGKTLLAKAIATNFSLNFFSVKGPELLNMYIGESEANVRKVFQKARDSKPCVVFFDELDSVAPKRGNQGDSGGVMDRIVSQLLAELDGMSGGANGEGVFVVGATNRPDLLDEALLRPGRFDKMVYLGVSDTHQKQYKILQALTRKFALSPNVSLMNVANKCPFTFTGADFYALCSDSMLNAMTRAANAIDVKINSFNDKRKSMNELPVTTQWWFENIAEPDDLKVLVTEEDFARSQRELVPSVSKDELDHYLRVRQNFEGGKEAAQKKVQQPLNGNETFVPNGIIIGNGNSNGNVNGNVNEISQPSLSQVVKQAEDDGPPSSDSSWSQDYEDDGIPSFGNGKAKVIEEIPEGTVIEENDIPGTVFTGKGKGKAN